MLEVPQGRVVATALEVSSVLLLSTAHLKIRLIFSKPPGSHDCKLAACILGVLIICCEFSFPLISHALLPAQMLNILGM